MLFISCNKIGIFLHFIDLIYYFRETSQRYFDVKCKVEIFPNVDFYTCMETGNTMIWEKNYRKKTIFTSSFFFATHYTIYNFTIKSTF